MVGHVSVFPSARQDLSEFEPVDLSFFLPEVGASLGILSSAETMRIFRFGGVVELISASDSRITIFSNLPTSLSAGSPLGNLMPFWVDVPSDVECVHAVAPNVSMVIQSTIIADSPGNR